jgi:hypothetical protein
MREASSAISAMAIGEDSMLPPLSVAELPGCEPSAPRMTSSSRPISFLLLATPPGPEAGRQRPRIAEDAHAILDDPAVKNPKIN